MMSFSVILAFVIRYAIFFVIAIVFAMIVFRLLAKIFKAIKGEKQ